MKEASAFPRRDLDLCPCCKRPLPPALTVSGPIRSRVLELVSRRPDGISIGEIVGIVYMDDPNGEPEWAENSIKTAVYNANKELRPQGFVIRARHGPGSRYRLLPMPA
jgi:hypothetical protein